MRFKESVIHPRDASFEKRRPFYGSSFISSRLKPIPHPDLRQDMFGPCGVLLDLLSQVADVHPKILMAFRRDMREVQRFVGAFYRAMDAVDLNVAKADPALAIFTSRPCNSAAAAWQTGFTNNRDDKS